MATPTIRLATEADKEALVALWAYCFSDSDAFRQWYFDHYYRKEECLVACDGEMPVASLQLIALPTRIGGRTVRAAYIVGVNCLPAYRGLGLTHQLMQEALDVYAPAHGIELIHLMPFEGDFYAQMGFVFGDYHADMHLPIEEFYFPADKAIARRFHWRSVDLARAEDEQALLTDLYARGAARYSGSFVLREDARRWQAFVSDLAMEGGYLAVLYDEENAPAGYIAYLVQENQLFIKEALATTEDARKAMYYFIASHRSQVKQVEWSAPENEPIIYQRKKDKSGVALRPFMMYDIVDPQVISIFASAQPDADLVFSVEGCGTYRWQAGCADILRLSDAVDEKTALSRHALNALVFDRAGWDRDDRDADIGRLAALFRVHPRIFHNEYF